MKKRYSKKEDDYILKHQATMTYSEMSAVLNRTSNSIRRRLELLQELKGLNKLGARPTIYNWTQEDDAYLLQHSSDELSELSKHFGVTKSAVRHRLASVLERNAVLEAPKMIEEADVINYLRGVSPTARLLIIRKANHQLPTTWEEFCETHPIQDGEVGFFSNDGSIIELDERERDYEENVMVLPNERLAEAIRALCMLIQLRECYRQGWKPNFDDDDSKFVIYTIGNELEKAEFFNANAVFSFQDKRTRDVFYDNFKDLLETAKELI